MHTNERTPLIVTSVGHSSNSAVGDRPATDGENHKRIGSRFALSGLVTLAFAVGLVVFAVMYMDKLPDDPERAALKILRKTPLIVSGVTDLPYMVRLLHRNNLSEINLEGATDGQVDIPRLRDGRVGGFFWSVYVDCADSGPDFMKPADRVRDTLEQIDVARLLIGQNSDTFELATTSNEVSNAVRIGRIASGHQLGNSIGVLRQYYLLGARYMTLTHACHNAFADSGGIFEPLPPLHGGLRLGMLVDLSHTSDETAVQALKLSQAPVIWSHSSARAVHNVARNVPDYILKMIGTGEGQKDAVVMINLLPAFLAPNDTAGVSEAADHVEHIGKIAGRMHVGLGSDFDGAEAFPKGLEDVSKYPALFAELIRRGWTREELEGVASKNFLRIFRGAEETARQMSEVPPSYALYDKRVEL
ncbi:Membrane dipeptidase (Peptidase family M19) [Ceratobasidium sp. AG-Ba]|nr:Membrane dipeptidase (Peptidase family M19) [Ceratobasidium sp. AG-Ba]